MLLSNLSVWYISSSSLGGKNKNFAFLLISNKLGNKLVRRQNYLFALPEGVTAKLTLKTVWRAFLWKQDDTMLKLWLWGGQEFRTNCRQKHFTKRGVKAMLQTSFCYNFWAQIQHLLTFCSFSHSVDCLEGLLKILVLLTFLPKSKISFMFLIWTCEINTTQEL